MRKILFLLLLLPCCLIGHSDEVVCCLTMIVKDDAAYIRQSLESVKGIVDCISICDLGSEDDTVQLIQEFMQENGISGKIHAHEWRDFGHNRTRAVESAQALLKETGASLNQSYLLILDGDQALKIGSGFRKNSLNADSYLLPEKSSDGRTNHYNVHLMRASKTWENRGVSLGYWFCKNGQPSVKLPTLMIEDLGGDEHRKIKMQRAIEMLAIGLQEDSENTHYQFHLAQSYKELKRYNEAIHWYKTRLEKLENTEEIWACRYMLGECYQEMGLWDQALYWYLEAFQYNPNRAEALGKLANYYRMRGQNDLAYIFAKHGSRIPYPSDQTLFDLPSLYEYGFNEDLSISSYYTRFREEGFLAANSLILNKSTPWHLKDQTYRNMLFYVKNLKDTQFFPIQLELPLIQKGYSERYHPMNPSILKTDVGYSVICRAVNYTQTGAKIFNTIDLFGIFRNKNYLVNYSREFQLLSQQEIVENLPRQRIRNSYLEGMEDCRIVELGHKKWFTCTTVDTNVLTGQYQISLCKLEDSKFAPKLQVEKLVPLKGPDPNRCEKNWLPFVKDQQLHMVYSYDPFVIYKPNTESGECETVLRYVPSQNFTSFRGSAGPLEFDDGYLILVHEVVLTPEYERIYLHRFLYLDKNFKVLQLTLPFTFLHQGVEYCCSMTIDHTTNNLVLAVGIEDREAHLCIVDCDTIRSLLSINLNPDP